MKKAHSESLALNYFVLIALSFWCGALILHSSIFKVVFIYGYCVLADIPTDKKINISVGVCFYWDFWQWLPRHWLLKVKTGVHSTLVQFKITRNLNPHQNIIQKPRFRNLNIFLLIMIKKHADKKMRFKITSYPIKSKMEAILWD